MRTSGVIRIDADLVDEIEKLSKVSKASCKEIASRAIRFALEYTVMTPTECYDISFVIKDDDKNEVIKEWKN